MKGFKFLSFGFDLPPSIVFGYFINLMLVLPGRKKIYFKFKSILNSHHQMSNQKGYNHSLSHLCGISWLEFVFLPFSLCLWNSRHLPRVDTAHLWCPRWCHFWHLLYFPRPFFSVWDKPLQFKPTLIMLLSQWASLKVFSTGKNHKPLILSDVSFNQKISHAKYFFRC